MKLKFLNKIILFVLVFTISSVLGGFCYAETFHEHAHAAGANDLGIKAQENIEASDCTKEDQTLRANATLSDKNKIEQAYSVGSFAFTGEIIKIRSLNKVSAYSPSPPPEKEMLSSVFKKE